jgi:hypothetical protein
MKMAKTVTLEEIWKAPISEVKKLLKIADRHMTVFILDMHFPNVDGTYEKMMTLTLERAQYFKEKFESGDTSDILGIAGEDLEDTPARMNLKPLRTGWSIRELPVTGVKYLSSETFLGYDQNDMYDIIGFHLFKPSQLDQGCSPMVFGRYYPEGLLNA